MNIPEAIEILKLDVKSNTRIDFSDWQNALKLGIEALKDKLKARRHGHAYSSRLLPGETKD